MLHLRAQTAGGRFPVAGRRAGRDALEAEDALRGRERLLQATDARFFGLLAAAARKSDAGRDARRDPKNSRTFHGLLPARERAPPTRRTRHGLSPLRPPASPSC